MNEEAYKKIVEEALALAKKKNADYSGSKIDNIGLTGSNGIAVRLLDKVSRIYNLTSGATPEVKTESIQDTAIDIVNYAVFLLMIERGEWTETPKPQKVFVWADEHTTESVKKELQNGKKD